MPELLVRPWRDKQEILSIRALLFPSEDDEPEEKARSQRLGINTIDAWTRRTTVPHAVLSTISLIDARLSQILLFQHGQHDGCPLSQSPFVVSSLYSTAIARFVTGFCDTAQTGAIKRTMTDVAAELGMPEAWVNMRHEIVHGHIPELRSMEEVAREAVGWLYEGYWLRIEEQSQAEPASPEQLRELLKIVYKERKEELRGGKEGKMTEALDQILAVLRTKEDLRVLAQMLVSSKFLLPRTKAQDINMKAGFFIWDTPLKYLLDEAPVLFGNLLEFLQNTLLSIEQAEKHAVIQWIIHFLSDENWEHARPREAHFDVIEFCILNPTSSTMELGNLLLEQSDVDFKEQYSRLFMAAQKGFTGEEQLNDEDSEEQTD